MRIFHRLFLTYMATAVVAVVISSGYTGFKVWVAARDSLQVQLIQYGRLLAAVLESQDWSGGDAGGLQAAIDTVAQGQSAHVWLVDREGLIRLASDSARGAAALEVPPETWPEVLRGDPVLLTPVRRERRGLTSPTVAVPVRGQGQVQGAIVLRPAPLTDRSRMKEGHHPIFFLYGSLLAGLPVAALSYYISQRIARPLTLVSEGAKRIGGGDFSVRVDWSSPDELGTLARGFNEMAAELGRLEAARRELMTTVSHELKGPLARVSGYLEAINDNMGGEEGRQAHERIVRQEVGRLTRLVNDLMDVSRIDAGRLKLHPIPCDLAPYLKRGAAVFEGPARSAGVALAVRLPDTLPIVLCEPERIEQVLANLLQNALAHTPSGGQVTVEATASAEDLSVTVTDNGPGIPAHELNRIWERFHKIDRARTPDKGGSGLGLTIVRQLVELQGGRVWVQSAPGQGSRFGFELPLATPEP